MRTVGGLLAAHPFFQGLDEQLVRRLEGCATNIGARIGDRLSDAGDEADRFLALRQGRVALEVHVPARGVQVLCTVEAGEVVGWSWFASVMYQRLHEARLRVLDLYEVDHGR